MAITTAQIHAAANQIDKEGKRPTLAGVRTVLGGGSFSTIQEAMKTWKRVEDDEAIEASPVPSDLSDAADTLIAKLWEIGEKLAAEALDHERETFQEQLQQADQTRDDAVSAADEIAEELAKSYAEIGKQYEEIYALREKLEATEKRATAHSQAHLIAEGLAEERAKTIKTLEHLLSKQRPKAAPAAKKV